MTMTLSVPQVAFARRAFTRIHRWIAICVAVVLCAWIAASLSPQIERVSPSVRSVQWQPAVEGARPLGSGWRAYETNAGVDGRAIWIRTMIDLSAEDARTRAAALALPGAFSARVWVNGVPIGGKGAPAFRAADERPGPIDAALPLGASVRPGVNEVLLFVSAQHANYRPEALLNGFTVLPHGGDAQRPLSRYAVAFSQAGVLLSIFAAFTLMAWRRDDDALRWAAAGAAFLLVAMAAETARVWWSYPYPLHVVRLSIIWLSLTASGIAVVQAAMARFTVAPSRLASAIGSVLLVAALMLIPSLDMRAALALIAPLLGIVFAVGKRAAAGDLQARALALLALATATLLTVRGPEVVDNWIYVSGALMLATLAWPKRAEPAPSPELALEGETVALADVVLVKAAGNYAEVHTTTGRTHFVRKALGELEAGAPLMRVHRSYIVNLDRARRFVAKTGSRYMLELGGGEAVPVSRKLADNVRAALVKRDASAQDILNRRTSHQG